MRATAPKAFRPPSNSLLRWLADPGAAVPGHVRALLLGELFTSPQAVFVGVVNGLILIGAALLLHGGWPFAAMTAATVGLGAARVMVAWQTAAAAERSDATGTDFALLTSILWCALQGLIVFTGMISHQPVLQALMAGTAMALLGPICARNYPAPRLAGLLMLLVEIPFLVGVALSGEVWLLAFVLQVPLYGYGSLMLVLRFNGLSVSRLLAQQESHAMARHDPLTGLLNRAGLLEEVQALHDGGVSAFTLFYLDLDGFKRINDMQGHQMGDRLLREVAHRLRACTRSRDILARLGGDEFVVVARALRPWAAPNLATTIIKRITNYEYGSDPEVPVRIGISIGFACCPEDGSTLAALLPLADAAMYESKRAGKGTFRRYGTNSPPFETVPSSAG